MRFEMTCSCLFRFRPKISLPNIEKHRNWLLSPNQGMWGEKTLVENKQEIHYLTDMHTCQMRCILATCHIGIFVDGWQCWRASAILCFNFYLLLILTLLSLAPQHHRVEARSYQTEKNVTRDDTTVIWMSKCNGSGKYRFCFFIKWIIYGRGLGVYRIERI